jgi:membrane-bound lytic murein transglycosylase D
MMNRLSFRLPLPALNWIAALAVAGCATPALDQRDVSKSGDPRTAPSDSGEGPAVTVRNPAMEGPAVARVEPGAAGVDAAPVETEPADVWSRLRDGFALPDISEDRIDAEIARYEGRQRYFGIVAERAQPYLRYILDRIEARDLPAELLLIPVVESAFRPFAYSHARAGGLWQFKPLTGKRFGLEQNWWYDGRRDVLASTDAALDYLEYLHGFFDGDWLLAIAAYNGGEGTVQRAVRVNAAKGQPTDYWHLDLPTQTEKYVPRILALRAILDAPGEYGITLPDMPEAESLTIVEVGDQVDLALAAEMAGMPLDALHRYNSGYNRWATPPDGPHRLAVPKRQADVLRTALASRDEGDMVRWRRHAVESGDTLGAIADRYGTTIGMLRDANNLDGSMIRVGEHLLVPMPSRDGQAYSLTLDNRRQSTQANGPAGRQRIDYRVRSGDTFWEIARSHDVEVRRLAAWNDMAPGDAIHPGQNLAIWVEGTQAGRGGPGESLQQVTYTVQQGDSLYAIARRFNLDVASIRRWNDLRAGAYLQPGQRLELEVDVTEQAEARP